jgi:hypothetical protein
VGIRGLRQCVPDARGSDDDARHGRRRAVKANRLPPLRVAIPQRKCAESSGRFRRMLITFLLSTVLPRGNHMDWFYWDTAWSLFFSVIWFMTITRYPDARIADAHLRDEAFGG